VVLGQRTSSGLISSGTFTVAERTAITGNGDGGSSNQGSGSGGDGAGSSILRPGTDAGALEQSAVQDETEQSGLVPVTDSNAGVLGNRVQDSQQGSNGQTGGSAGTQPEPGTEVLFEAEIEVGELDAFTCEAPPQNPDAEPEDC